MDGITEGMERRQLGLDLVEENNQSFVEQMRDFARRRCLQHGSVSSDDCRRFALSNGIEPNHKNAWGAIFRGNEWVAVGMEKSKHPSNHGRRIVVWGRK